MKKEKLEIRGDWSQSQSLADKTNNLLRYLKSLESVVVAFSGGVDSTFLAAAAKKALGDKAVAFTVDSPTLPVKEKNDAQNFAKELDIKQEIIYIDELQLPKFVENGPERCYFCKRNRFELLCDWAKQRKIKWVLDGSNLDDTKDYRPGMKAIEELPNVKSPLLELGFTKADIRVVAKEWGLLVWDKESSPCLATRIPYGQPITAENLACIDKGEAFLKPLLQGSFRVRYHHDIARLEVEASEFARFVDSTFRRRIVEKLEELGFSYVVVDLMDFKSGNMNKVVKK